MEPTGAGVTELRVHGVSGTPPEAMLGLPRELITQVAGDRAAGFYRPKVADGASTRTVEVYSWGGLTSGPASRALWLLFLPFILINLSHWMLPPANPRSRVAALAGSMSVRVLRLIGLSLTLTLMLAAVLALTDVAVWQCGGLDYCGAHLGPASFLVDLPRGRQLALGALPVALMIGGILLLGRANPSIPKGRPPDPAVMRGDVPLADDTFWVGDVSVTRLRACHVTVWASGLSALTLFAPERWSWQVPTVVLFAANAVMFAIALVATAITRVTGRGGAGADSLTRPLQFLQWLSVGVLIVTLVWVAFAPATYLAPPTHLPGLRGAVYALLAAQAVLLVALFVCTAFARATTSAEGFRPTLRGFTAPVTATIAWLVGGGFSTGVGLLAALYLGSPVSSTAEAGYQVSARNAIIDGAALGSPATPAGFEDRVRAVDADAPLIVPPPFFWTAIVFVVLLLIVFAVALWIWLRVVRSRASAGQAVVLSDYTSDPTPEERERARTVAAARAWASVTDLAIPLVAGVAAVAVILVSILLVVYFKEGYASVPAFVPTLTKVSVMIIAAAAAGLVAVAIWAFRNRQARRMVGVLWDVATFWPRANHPLTPPCYAERSVPELLNRVTTLSIGPTEAVVLAAHSQGSIIAAATMLQAGRQSQRAALLTFGCPLRRLYARNFPAYFGSNTLWQLRDQQHRRWINMWALSDPIGSWLLSEGAKDADRALADVDYRLLDVTDLSPDADGTYPPICGHSGFWTRPEYRAAVNLLVSVVLPGSSARDQTASAPPDSGAV